MIFVWEKFFCEITATIQDCSQSFHLILIQVLAGYLSANIPFHWQVTYMDSIQETFCKYAYTKLDGQYLNEEVIRVKYNVLLLDYLRQPFVQELTSSKNLLLLLLGMKFLVVKYRNFVKLQSHWVPRQSRTNTSYYSTKANYSTNRECH